MARETGEAPATVARMLDRNGLVIAELGNRLRQLEPPVLVTCGRGSSDHAAGYLSYLVEIILGIPCASLGPSIASVYAAPLKLRGRAMITVSQSGQSPDIVALQRAAKAGGAITIALVNAIQSPVAKEADFVIPLHAGIEDSVAATKTFISACAAAAAIAASWSGDKALQSSVQRLPETLLSALEQDWSAAESLASCTSLYVLGRGPALPIAMEAALKLKETASLHAEAFSFAEVMHGPLQLVAKDFPILGLAPDDQSATTTRLALQRLVASGAEVFTASPLAMPGSRLAAVATGHGLTDPIAMIQSFYGLAERIARLRGYDPDKPERLRKVTETV